MPSAARIALSENLKDVETLVKLHGQLGGNTRGRRYGLEVLNKSAVVLMIAFWESYCEDIAAEALAHLVKHSATPDKLPADVRKQIAAEIKAEKNDLEPWKLAGDGWRAYLEARLVHLQQQRNWDLMTPNSENIDKLFLKSLGIKQVSENWKIARNTTPARVRKKLNDLVRLRGNIAHRGKNTTSVKKQQVDDARKLITRLAAKTGGVVNRHVHSATGVWLW